MAKFESPNEISEVLAAPIGDIISAVGRSLAEAQRAMDAQAIENFIAIYDEGRAAFEALRSIGYQPTWYQIPEATVEIAIALSASGSRVDTETGARRLMVYGAPVDAGYQSRFNYGVQGSSSLKFRIVPVPPPTLATRMRVVPDLAGLTLAEARTQLDGLGIRYEVTPANAIDAWIISAQRPSAGSVLPLEAVLFITAAETP